jgi:hypothetical protein
MASARVGSPMMIIVAIDCRSAEHRDMHRGDDFECK